MALDLEVELLKAAEVSPLFKTTPAIITSAIKNGTLPIGFVGEREETRTIIVKKRLLAWLNANDLNIQIQAHERQK